MSFNGAGVRGRRRGVQIRRNALQALQRGRRPRTPERRPSWEARPEHLASTGPASGTPENGSQLARRRLALCFNGAGVRGRRRGTGREADRWDLGSFNGAGVRGRRRGARPRGAFGLVDASTGPPRGGRRRATSRSRPTDARLQRGRRPRTPERPPLDWRDGSPGFNGAGVRERRRGPWPRGRASSSGFNGAAARTPESPMRMLPRLPCTTPSTGPPSENAGEVRPAESHAGLAMTQRGPRPWTPERHVPRTPKPTFPLSFNGDGVRERRRGASSAPCFSTQGFNGAGVREHRRVPEHHAATLASPQTLQRGRRHERRRETCITRSRSSLSRCFNGAGVRGRRRSGRYRQSAQGSRASMGPASEDAGDAQRRWWGCHQRPARFNGAGVRGRRRSEAAKRPGSRSRRLQWGRRPRTPNMACERATTRPRRA